MSRKPISINVVDEADGRYVVTIFADGREERKRIDPDAKPRRKPRKPQARAYGDRLNKTRMKRY